MITQFLVTLAQAGTQERLAPRSRLGSRFRGNDEEEVGHG
jgi:hypothetical protein